MEDLVRLKSSLGQRAADDGKIARLARSPLDRVTFAFDQLNKKQLVVRRVASHPLTTEAVEVMALRDCVRKNLIAAQGAIIANGKESDVYKAFNDGGELFALEFFKPGRTSFTRARKKRFVDKSEMKNWMTVGYEAARREYMAPRKLEGVPEAFPKAVACNRSTDARGTLGGKVGNEACTSGHAEMSRGHTRGGAIGVRAWWPG